VGFAFHGQLDKILEFYKFYFANWEKCVEIVNSLKDNEKFVEFLASKRADVNTGGASFMLCLFLPIQRIVRYYVLLHELQSNTEATHSEYALVQQSLEKILSLCTAINSRKHELENTAKILHVQTNVQGKYPQLLVPNRKFIMEGEFHKVNGKTFYLYLFSDLILWCNVKYEFRGSVPLISALLQSYADPKQTHTGSVVGFRVLSLLSQDDKEQKEGIVCLCTVKEKMAWMKAINDAITSAREAAKQRRETAYGQKNRLNRKISSALTELTQHLAEARKALKEKEEKEANEKKQQTLDEEASAKANLASNARNRMAQASASPTHKE